MILLTLCLALFLVLVPVRADEPQCSKFHYEAQTLDKMIRTEVKIEAMEKEILKTNQQVLETLQALREEKEKINKDNADMKKKMSDAVKAMADNTEVMRDTLLTPTVAFKARGPADKSLDTGQTLIFSKIMLNEGTAYDNVTGIFTAPVAGTYLFFIHLCTNGANSFHYGIVYDDVVYTSGRFYENTGYVCFVADAILVLETGQKVWVKCLHGQTPEVLYEYSSTYNYWNTFSGVLLHK